MQGTYSKFHPSTGWITTGMLTFVVTAFGIFAQSHASERDASLADVSTNLSAHAMQLLRPCKDSAVISNIRYQ